MRFKILNATFIDAISNVSRALSTKTPMPILKSIKIDVVSNGIHLTASDANITIKQFIPLVDKNMVIEETGSAAIPGKLLLEVLRKVNEEYVEIALYEDKFIKINFKNSDYTLNCFDVREYPNINIVKTEQPIKLSTQLLYDVIRQTVISVSTNESRPLLTGVNFNISDQKLQCIATDSYRLSQKTIDLPDATLQNINIIVPGKSLQELEKIIANANNEIEIHLSNNMIAFIFDHIVFQSRLLNGQYPDTKRLIPTEFGLELTLSRQELIEVVDRVSLLSREGATNIIKFDIFEEKTIISLDSPEIGKVIEEIRPISQKGSLIRIGFNSKYLLDALRVLNEDEVMLKFTGEVRPFIIKTTDDTVTQLILPVRIE